MHKAGIPEEYLEIAEDGVRFLAQLNGLEIGDADLGEVTFRLRAILTAAKQLEKLDLQGVEPIPVTPPRIEV